MNRERAAFITSEIERVDGELLDSSEKHQKMASSPFVFFRGSAQLYYADLAAGNLVLPEALLSLPLTTIMGDCHTANFGFLTEEGSHGDKVIFCPNDFDDACIGHAGWDLLRFVTSLYLCHEHCQRSLDESRLSENDDKNSPELVSKKALKRSADSFIDGYLKICEQAIDGQDHFDFALHKFNDSDLMQKALKKAKRRAAGGKDFLDKSALVKAVDFASDHIAFKQNPERYQQVDGRRYRALFNAFSPYMDDVVLDIVERLGAGTGSVNMQRYYFLVGPQQLANAQELALCHIVEVKQQRQAAPIHYFPDLSQVNRLAPAHLTQVCQKRMQRRPDLVLDEAVWQRKHWLIRSRHHARVGFDPEDIMLGKDKKVNDGLIDYAQNCGKSLALAHCRGDRRSLIFEKKMLDQLPIAKEELKHQAKAYAEQANQDCNWLAEKIT